MLKNVEHAVRVVGQGMRCACYGTFRWIDNYSELRLDAGVVCKDQELANKFTLIRLPAPGFQLYRFAAVNGVLVAPVRNLLPPIKGTYEGDVISAMLSEQEKAFKEFRNEIKRMAQ